MFLDRPEVQRPGHKYHILAREEIRSILEEEGFKTRTTRIPILYWITDIVFPEAGVDCEMVQAPGTAVDGEWRIEKIAPASNDVVRDCYRVYSFDGDSVLLANRDPWYLPACPRGAPSAGDGGVSDKLVLLTTCSLEAASKLVGVRVTVDADPRLAESWIIEAVPPGYRGLEFIVELPWPGSLSRILRNVARAASSLGARVVVVPGRDGGDPSLNGASWSYGAHFYSSMLKSIDGLPGVRRQLWVDPREWGLWPPAWGGWSWSWLHGILQGRVHPDNPGSAEVHRIDLARILYRLDSHIASLLYFRIYRLDGEALREVWRRHGRPVAALRGGEVVWDGYVLAPELYGYSLVSSGLADMVVDLSSGEVLYWRRSSDPWFSLEYRHRMLVYRVQHTLEEVSV